MATKHNFIIVWNGTIGLAKPSAFSKTTSGQAKQSKSSNSSNKTKYSSSTATAVYKTKKAGSKRTRKSSGTAMIVIDRK